MLALKWIIPIDLISGILFAVLLKISAYNFFPPNNFRFLAHREMEKPENLIPLLWLKMQIFFLNIHFTALFRLLCWVKNFQGKGSQRVVFSQNIVESNKAIKT